MRHRWRAEEDPRERYPPSYLPPRDRDRDWDSQHRRPTSPPSTYRGGEHFESHREPHWADRDRREPPRKRPFSRDRDTRKFRGRPPSISPPRLSQPKYHSSSRQQIQERLSRRRDLSPPRSVQAEAYSKSIPCPAASDLALKIRDLVTNEIFLISTIGARPAPNLVLRFETFIHIHLDQYRLPQGLRSPSVVNTDKGSLYRCATTIRDPPHLGRYRDHLRLEVLIRSIRHSIPPNHP